MINVKELLKQAKHFTTENSPAILTALGVAGVVSTSILAVRSTPRAWQYIMEAQSEHERDLTNKEKVMLTWQCYLPALGMAAVTIACIIGANSISSRRNAALVSVYTLTETALKEYKEKTLEVVGEGKEQKIRDQIAQDKITNNPPVDREVIITGNGDQLCRDTLSGRYFMSSMEKVQKAVNEINHKIINDEYASVNDFYILLDLDTNEIGDTLGWNTDRLMNIQYSGALTPEGKAVISLDHQAPPSIGFDRLAR